MVLLLISLDLLWAVISLYVPLQPTNQASTKGISKVKQHANAHSDCSNTLMVSQQVTYLESDPSSCFCQHKTIFKSNQIWNMNYMKFFQEQFWHFVSRPKITILTNEYLGVVNAKSATETNLQTNFNLTNKNFQILFTLYLILRFSFVMFNHLKNNLRKVILVHYNTLRT